MLSNVEHSSQQHDSLGKLEWTPKPALVPLRQTISILHRAFQVRFDSSVVGSRDPASLMIGEFSFTKPSVLFASRMLLDAWWGEFKVLLPEILIH